MQIACPKCNSILEFPSSYIHDGGCPRCGTQIRIRKGKAYEQSQIVDNLLYSITVLFAQIAKEDLENINIYQNLFNNFVGRQALTKNQLNDINNTFKSEQKGGLFHDNYKKVIKALKEDLDYAYRQSEISAQENTENTVFSLLLQMAYSTGNIKPEQQLILDEYIKCFCMSKERVLTFTTKYQPKQKKEINIEEAFSRVIQNAQTLFFHQEKFVNELSISLKRPYIYPQQNPFKSLSFILTQEEDLVLDIFNKMLSDMRHEELIQELPLILECTEFSDDTNLNNFGNKLLEFFNSQNEVILLKNFKALSPSALNFFSSIITGKNSQVKCNNKFIFLLTSGSQDEIYNLMAEEFYNKITDIVKLEDLTDEEIEALITNCTNNLINNLRNSLNINLYYDPKILGYLKGFYNKNIGMKSIVAFAEHNIRKPIMEYKLKNEISSQEKIILFLAEEKLALYQNEQTILLEQFMLKPKNANLDEIKDKLNKIIGLGPVKEYVLKLEDNVAAQKIRQEAGFKTSALSMNMIFTGNPGTGKTTVARIVAEYLKALGVISKGQCIEVTRSDLVGEYQGQTAQKASSVINSAIGGVLFIDEAYSLYRGGNDSFGLEAVDILVKMMEDNKNNLVVILAGYSKEMDEFLKSNSGLKSRFPNFIDFPDYTSTEMYQIAQKIAKENDYAISADCIEPLIQYFEAHNYSGNNSSGNGRLARNVVEKAILNQSNRIIKENDGDYQTLKLIDFELEDSEEAEEKLNEIKDKLSKIIGLGPVKEYVLKLEDNVLAQKKRNEAGFKTSPLSMNMIFTGNPGTGKTTVARIVAEYLKALGVISNGQCIEVTRSELVGEYQGQTAQKASNVISSAIGGVLFIDEAYSLYRGDNDSFGVEAIDTLVKMMEDHKNNLVVILAGYSKEMNEFLKSNSGLKSRFPNFIDFPDYTPNEMYQIAEKIAKGNDYEISKDCVEPLTQYFEAHNFKGNNSAGNGRLARNIVEKAILNQSNRIIKENDDDYQTLKLPDFEIEDPEKEKFNLEENLSQIIGLDEVKNYIRSLAAKINVGRQREKMGLANNSVQTLHMIFKGNPGTGKTMMARTVANMLYNLGVINTNNVVETDRAGLVAGYVGQTAEKTTEKVYEAMNGVLFIDEAYTLAQGGENDFGREAIDTLLKLMDDNRDKLVVILAGYSDNMENFLNTNPGLLSRFPNIVEFKDYNLEELLNIATLTYKKNGYELSESAYNKLSQILDEARVNPKFGNGRYVRNIFEKSLTKQALRVSILPELTKEDLITITDEDIEKL